MDVKPLALNDDNDLLKLLLELQRTSTYTTSMQRNRGFMTIEGVQPSPNNDYVDVWGVAKGNGFSPYEHVHLTGFGDLELMAMGSGFNRDSIQMVPTKQGAQTEGMDVEEVKVAFKDIAAFNCYRESDGIDSFSMFPN